MMIDSALIGNLTKADLKSLCVVTQEDEGVYEGGVQLVDMIYMKRDFDLQK